MKSTNKTAVYLEKKASLEKAIKWYNETIEAVNKQQEDRKIILEELKETLFNLEKEYYEG